MISHYLLYRLWRPFDGVVFTQHVVIGAKIWQWALGNSAVALGMVLSSTEIREKKLFYYIVVVFVLFYRKITMVKWTSNIIINTVLVCVCWWTLSGTYLHALLEIDTIHKNKWFFLVNSFGFYINYLFQNVTGKAKPWTATLDHEFDYLHSRLYENRLWTLNVNKICQNQCNHVVRLGPLNKFYFGDT